MKTILGITMIIAGVVLGLYVGLWLMFIGGIAGLINVVVGAVAGHGISGMVVAIDVVKIMFAGLAGWLSAFVLVIPGLAMLKK